MSTGNGWPHYHHHTHSYTRCCGYVRRAHRLYTPATTIRTSTSAKGVGAPRHSRTPATQNCTLALHTRARTQRRYVHSVCLRARRLARRGASAACRVSGASAGSQGDLCVSRLVTGRSVSEGLLWQTWDIHSRYTRGERVTAAKGQLRGCVSVIRCRMSHSESAPSSPTRTRTRGEKTFTEYCKLKHTFAYTDTEGTHTAWSICTCTHAVTHHLRTGSTRVPGPPPSPSPHRPSPHPPSRAL